MPRSTTALAALLLAALLAPGAAHAGEETQTYPFVLPHEYVGAPVWREIGFGSVQCRHPGQDEELPVTARYCLKIPLETKTIEVRVENVATGTGLDPMIVPVGVDYGTNYTSGAFGEFCGTATITLPTVVTANPRLILEPRGPLRGREICGSGPALRAGTAIAGQLVVTFRW